MCFSNIIFNIGILNKVINDLFTSPYVFALMYIGKSSLRLFLPVSAIESDSLQHQLDQPARKHLPLPSTTSYIQISLYISTHDCVQRFGPQAHNHIQSNHSSKNRRVLQQKKRSHIQHQYTVLSYKQPEISKLVLSPPTKQPFTTATPQQHQIHTFKKTFTQTTSSILRKPTSNKGEDDQLTYSIQNTGNSCSEN